MSIGIIDTVIGVAAPLLDKFIVDKDKKAEFEHELKMSCTTQTYNKIKST